MPYISQVARFEVDHEIEELLDAIVAKEENLPGVMNYIFTSLLEKFKQDKWNYNKINSVIGMLECCKLEFYRRLAAPYEDKKIVESGDVETYRDN